jgi:hypothetical protein
VGQAGGAAALMAARCAQGEGPVRRRNASRRGAWRPAPAEVGDARPACSVDDMTGEGDMGLTHGPGRRFKSIQNISNDFKSKTNSFEFDLFKTGPSRAKKN